MSAPLCTAAPVAAVAAIVRGPYAVTAAAAAMVGTVAAVVSTATAAVPAAAAAVPPAAAVLAVPRRRPLPRVYAEHMPGQPLSGFEGVVQLAHAPEDEHCCMGVKGCVPNLLLAQGAPTPVGHLRHTAAHGGHRRLRRMRRAAAGRGAAGATLRLTSPAAG